MPSDGRQNRVFLRIPVKFPAELYAGGQLLGRARIVDLSSNGVAFILAGEAPLPDELEIHFRLKRFSTPVRILLQVRNRVACAEGMRFGCIFREVAEPDKKRIDRYIRNFSGISFPEMAVSSAAFLCAIDASIRALLYFVISYYAVTDFGRGAVDPVAPGLSAVALFVYVVAAFAAFVLSAPSLVRRSKLSFISALCLIGYCTFFLLMKNVACWQEGLWDLKDHDITTLLAAQVLLFLFVTFAFLTGMFFVRKMALVLDVVKQEFSVLKLGLAHLDILRKQR